MTMNGGARKIPHLTGVEALRQRGGSTVYLATDLKLDRRVTVVVAPPIGGGADRTSFDRRARILGRVSAHPNVVTVFDAGVTADREPYLVSEQVDGIDLAEHLELNGPMTWPDAIEATLQLCDGLEQAHRAGLLHYDVRPENVAMSGMVPRLNGFAIAALSDGSASTEVREAVHTPPEGFDGRWDERSDLYSLASTLFQMVDGRAPFWRPGQDTMDALLLRLGHELPPDLDPDRGPSELSVFLKAALSRDPIDRPQSASEFADELRHVARQHRPGDGPSVLHATTSALPAVGVAGATTLADLLPAGHSGSIATDSPVGTATEAIPVTSASAPNTLTTNGPPLAPRPSAPARPTQYGDAAFGAQPQTGPIPAVSDGTAVFTSLPSDPSVNASEISSRAGHRGDDTPKATRSPAFLVAAAMIMVGVLGLVAVLTVNRFNRNEATDDAPVLPAVTDPSSLNTDDGSGDDPTTAADAMDDAAATTTTEAPQEETTTTAARVIVPDLVGVDVDAATRQLTDLGLGVNVVGRIIPGAQAGVVAQQTPDAGGAVTVPLSVTLFIPRTANLPEMTGKTATAVCAELKALQVQCVQTLQHDAQIPTGIVISTSPAAGSEFEEGSSVEMIVSKGPVVSLTVPDIANQTQEEADLALSEAGFVSIEFEMEPSDSVENGRATRTDPASGSMLASDQTVLVYLSSGPPQQVAIPEITGQSEADATTALTEAGLVAAVANQDLPADDPGIGTVLSTDPAVGTMVDGGTTVTITVGKQADPDSTTTTVAESSE